MVEDNRIMIYTIWLVCLQSPVGIRAGVYWNSVVFVGVFPTCEYLSTFIRSLWSNDHAFYKKQKKKQTGRDKFAVWRAGSTWRLTGSIKVQEAKEPVGSYPTASRVSLNSSHFVGSQAFETCFGPCCRPAHVSCLTTSLTIFSQAVQKIVQALLHSSLLLITPPTSLPLSPLSNCWLQALGSLLHSSPAYRFHQPAKRVLGHLAHATICCTIFSSSK